MVKMVCSSGFKSAADTRNLLKQVSGGIANRLQPVLYTSSGIHPACERAATAAMAEW
jgi:hypothetical protein